MTEYAEQVFPIERTADEGTLAGIAYRLQQLEDRLARVEAVASKLSPARTNDVESRVSSAEVDTLKLSDRLTHLEAWVALAVQGGDQCLVKNSSQVEPRSAYRRTALPLAS